MDWMLASAATLVPLAVYHLWVVRRLKNKLTEVRSNASNAYATGYEHGVEATHALRDTEIEARTRRAYNAGWDAAKLQPKRQRVEVA